MIVSVEESSARIPKKNRLYSNYPNPFNPSTTIRYDLHQPADVQIIVYDILGQQVATLASGNQTAGYKSVHWNGLNESGNQVSSGIYLCHLKTTDFTQTIRMVYLR